jgi:hypothetical protein
MSSVFILWHVHEVDGNDDEKLIGVYASPQEAEAAILRLRDKPGFRDTPQGFQIHEYVIGRDGWTEGYVLD